MTGAFYKTSTHWLHDTCDIQGKPPLMQNYGKNELPDINLEESINECDFALHTATEQ